MGNVVVDQVVSENSRIQPKLYTYILVGCDLLALVVQAIGGGPCLVSCGFLLEGVR